MKKPTKRKMYQKRRKREKLQQRRKDVQSMLPGKTATAFLKYSKKKQNEQYPANINNCDLQSFTFSPITSYSQGLQSWWQTYCSAIEFHSQQQNAWQADSQDNYSLLLQKYANEYETSSEEEDENEVQQRSDTYERTENTNDGIKEEYVDQEYIKFLEITHKHREEMRLKRAKDNC